MKLLWCNICNVLYTSCWLCFLKLLKFFEFIWGFCVFFTRSISVNNTWLWPMFPVLFCSVNQGLLTAQSFSTVFYYGSVFSIPAGYPSLRIEKNDLRSVTLMEAKAKVKDIAISRERVTLRDVLHEGICISCSLFLFFSVSLYSFFLLKKLPNDFCVLQKGVNIISRIRKGDHTFRTLLLALQSIWSQVVSCGVVNILLSSENYSL